MKRIHVIMALMLTLCLALPAAAAVSVETKPVLLVVSFGTSYNDSRDVTIGAVEQALQAAYPDYEVRRAFTSQIIIDILKERENLEIDNVIEAMERLVAEGMKDVVLQPTHVMNGFEYDDIIAEIAPYREKFDSFRVGNPLLITQEDYDQVVAAVVEGTAQYNQAGTAVVFMGHGTEHASNATYAKVQQKLNDAGYNNYFVGTVEAEPTVEEVLEMVKESGAEKVVMLPFMVVAGDHAHNDMAGDEEDSWKTIFTEAGFEVECVLEGLGQNTAIQQIYVAHAAAAMAQ